MSFSEFPIRQKNGCRVYGPNPNHKDLIPPRGSEVFVGRIPPDFTAKELHKFFSRLGNDLIYEIRWMLNFSGESRKFSFVKFLNEETAQRAILELNGRYLRPGQKVAVNLSTDHKTLVLLGAPKDVTELEIQQELEKRNKQVNRVEKVDCNKMVFKIEFADHAAAATSKRMNHDELFPEDWRNIQLLWASNPIVEQRIQRKKERMLLSTSSLKNVIQSKSDFNGEDSESHKEQSVQPPHGFRPILGTGNRFGVPA